MTNDSSTTSAASLNPASTSPIVHWSPSDTWPMGIRPDSASAKSVSVHFRSKTLPLTSTFPWRRALGPPGRRLSSGSTTNGNGS